MTTLATCVSLARRGIRKAARTPAWLARSALGLYTQLVHQLVLVLTERYWLIDYLPKKSIGNESVLLVRLDLIGDFVIWLDAAKEFKKLYPNKKIVLCANAIWAQLAQKLPYWDEVIEVDVSRLRAQDGYRLRVLTKIHARGFEIAIQPTYSREYVADLLVRASQANERIAHLGDTNNITLSKKIISDKWYTCLIPLASNDQSELSANAHLLRELGQPDFKSSLPIIEKLSELPSDLSLRQSYCVIIPGASWEPKMWPVENFITTAQTICAGRDLRVLVCGTAQEQNICQRIVVGLGDRASNCAGKTTLLQFIEIIRNSVLVIANDSGAVHIAVATNTPAVCIVGGGHFGRFLPYVPETVQLARNLPTVVNKQLNCYGCLWRCLYPITPGSAVPCVSLVEVRDVADACHFALRHLPKAQ